MHILLWGCLDPDLQQQFEEKKRIKKREGIWEIVTLAKCVWYHKPVTKFSQKWKFHVKFIIPSGNKF